MTRCTAYDHLTDPVERAWLTSVEPAAVAANAHRFYDYLRDCGLAADSYTREMAFEKTADALGIDYDCLYNAWLDQRPLTLI